MPSWWLESSWSSILWVKFPVWCCLLNCEEYLFHPHLLHPQKNTQWNTDSQGAMTSWNKALVKRTPYDLFLSLNKKPWQPPYLMNSFLHHWTNSQLLVGVGKVLSNVKWEKTHDENRIQSFQDNNDVNSPPFYYNVPATTTKIPTFFP